MEHSPGLRVERFFRLLPTFQLFNFRLNFGFIYLSTCSNFFNFVQLHAELWGSTFVILLTFPIFSTFDWIIFVSLSPAQRRHERRVDVGDFQESQDRKCWCLDYVQCPCNLKAHSATHLKEDSCSWNPHPNPLAGTS